MENFANEGITQKTMAKFASVSNSTISRCISHNKIVPIEEGGKNLKYMIPDVRKIISSTSELPREIKRKKHAFYNFKGGTGKTSLCYQVSSHIALMGYKVLVIDADPQAHLSLSLNMMRDDSLTLYDIIVGKQKFENVVQKVFEGLDCIPSNLSLTRLETELSHLPKREERLLLDLKEIEEKYDFIFIDTNPTISVLNRNVISFCDVLDIVCETQPYSLNGLKLLMEDLNRFFHYMNLPSKKINIIPNKYEDRTANSAEAMTVLKSYYSEYIKQDFAVRRSEDLVTSAKLAKPLAFFAKKNSIALDDIAELVHYIISISI